MWFLTWQTPNKALGYARALHAAGRLSSGGYLITNSGASWLSLPLCFQRRVTPEDFLGPVLPPETLALAAARGDGRRGFAATIARARILRSYTCVAVALSARSLMYGMLGDEFGIVTRTGI